MGYTIDRIPPRFICERIFQSTFKGGERGRNKRLACGMYNTYTDGSKIDDGVGAEAYYALLDLKQPFKLPQHCNIFQTKVVLVGKAAEMAS